MAGRRAPEKNDTERRQPESGRLDGLDTLRGAALISMFLYHMCWDIVYLFGADWAWYRSYGAYLWQQSICWTFILLSGFCFHLGRHRVRRGVVVFVCGWLVSAVTDSAMPGNAVFFGVLSLLGAAALLTIPFDSLFRRIPARVGLAVCIVLFFVTRDVPGGLLGFGGVPLAFQHVPEGVAGLITGFAGFLTWLVGLFYGLVNFLSGLGLTPPDFTAMLPDFATLSFSGVAAVRLPESLYLNGFTAALGFPPLGFRSTDYFPLLPWLFLYWAGYFLYPLHPSETPRLRLPVLTTLGRHSLLAYMLHQPVIYGVLSLLSGMDPAGMWYALRNGVSMARELYDKAAAFFSWFAGAVEKFIADIRDLYERLKILWEVLHSPDSPL